MDGPDETKPARGKARDAGNFDQKQGLKRHRINWMNDEPLAVQLGARSGSLSDSGARIRGKH
jgi:hypothetical protein